MTTPMDPAPSREQAVQWIMRLADGYARACFDTAGGAHAARDALESAVRALAAQPAPIQEPTRQMVKAAADAWIDCRSNLILNRARAALLAGLAAGPRATQPAVGAAQPVPQAWTTHAHIHAIEFGKSGVFVKEPGTAFCVPVTFGEPRSIDDFRD